MEPKIADLQELRDRTAVFRDRAHAGEVLAGMLAELRGSPAIVLAIPAGGVPVGKTLARRLDLPLDVAVVSKITPPGNTEVGYGAVAFDGTVRINSELADRLGLDSSERIRGIEATSRKVMRRSRMFRAGRPFPKLANRPVVLVDDGLATGFTMLVAIEAVRKLGAASVTVAVPTGHAESVARAAEQADTLVCANLRRGRSFAVADAYEEWGDVRDEEVVWALES
jgi:putative phosphoribosyl transferase